MFGRQILNSLDAAPAFLEGDDLVAMGLFPSRMALHKARERGNAPPEIMLSKRVIRFPKESLIEWLDEKRGTHGNASSVSGSVPVRN